MNTAIIVAAGGGERFGGNTPKQFLEIRGKSLIAHTLDVFVKAQAIDEIILVLPSGETNLGRNIADEFGIGKISDIVAGGNTRALSVYNAFEQIDPETAEIVAIHDGVRPLVTQGEISKTIEKAKEIGAACLVGEITDTMKEIENGKIMRTIDRKQLRRALTPQCFRYAILKRAYDGNPNFADATDECYLVEKIGGEIAVVEGKSTNIKVTRPIDFALVAEALSEMK